MIRSVAATALALLVASSPAPAQTTLAEYTGGPAAYLSAVVGGHDLNLDGVPDLVTGARFDNTAGADAGAVYARSGATGAILWWRFGSAPVDHFGTSLAMSPDLDGDGVWDVVVGAPGAGPANEGMVYVLSGLTSAPIFSFVDNTPNDLLGVTVAADFDWNQDGTPDVGGGAPYGSGSGHVVVLSGNDGSVLMRASGLAHGAQLFGADLLGGADVDGDGFNDLTLSALGWVYVLRSTGNAGRSVPGAILPTLGIAGDTNGDGGDELLVGDPLYDGTHTDGGAVWLQQLEDSFAQSLLLEGDAPGQNLGQVVAGLGDIDGDGRQDWAIAATNGLSNPGHVRVLSGKFKQELYRLSGSPATQFPADLAGVGDTNGDGFLDLAVADPNAGASDDGIVAVFSAHGPGFVNYCTPGTSASGCQATLSASGTPAAFQAVPFVLSASGVEGGTPGLYFYGWNGRQTNVWGNGTSLQCVTPPVKRAGVLPSTGTTGQCDGTFSQDLNAHWAANSAKNPGPGAICQAQLWYRDPFSTSNQTTSMSDALEFFVDF